MSKALDQALAASKRSPLGAKWMKLYEGLTEIDQHRFIDAANKRARSEEHYAKVYDRVFHVMIASCIARQVAYWYGKREGDAVFGFMDKRTHKRHNSAGDLKLTHQFLTLSKRMGELPALPRAPKSEVATVPLRRGHVKLFVGGKRPKR